MAGAGSLTAAWRENRCVTCKPSKQRRNDNPAAVKCSGQYEIWLKAG